MSPLLRLIPSLSLLAIGLTANALTLDDYPYSFTPDPERYSNEVASLTQGDAANPPLEGAIACVGSSSMRMWAGRIHNDLEGLTVIPRGFGGSHFSDAIYYADELILKYRPRAVLVYEGDNDSANSKSTERIVDDLDFLVRYCRETLPDLRFYIISVKPATARFNIWPEVVEANAAMKAYCEENEGMVYIDVASALLGDDNEPLPDIFVSDGIHLNTKGYDLWSGAIAPVLLENELPYEEDLGCLDCRDLRGGDTLYFDFGSASSEMTNPDGSRRYWNNITSTGAIGGYRKFLLTSEGDSVRTNFVTVQTFNNINSGGVDDGTIYPARASGDSFWSGNGAGHEEALLEKAVIRFSGLSDDLVYSLSAFPSRTGDDGGNGRLTRYQVKDTVIDIEASDNTETLATFTNLSPSPEGWIDLQVSVSPDGNARFAYLNVLTLTAEGATSPDNWAGYSIVDGDLVDTGNWLGWLYVGAAPWLFSYSLTRWIYLTEDAVTPNGAWTYLAP